MFHKFGFSSAIIIGTLALSSCKTIETPNGEIPQEAMPYVDKVVGTYQNSVDHSEISLRMEGTKLVASVYSKNSLDVIDSQCQSEIQDLEKIQLTDNNTVINGIFAFNRQYCLATLVGNTIKLQVREVKNSQTQATERVLTAVYVLENKMEKECKTEFPVGQPPQQSCTVKSTPVYFKKNFIQR
jgi:hypothetical protein